MKFEHTLSPAAASIFKAGVEQLNQCRLEQLRALGLAKEAEMQSAAIQQIISQHVAVIQQTEGLPAPASGSYQLSADCTRLVAEVADKPAPANVQPIAGVAASSPAAAERINGAAGADRV